MEKIFGIPKEEIDRQLKARSRDYEVDPEYKMSPIKAGETLEPCIRGAQKILDDPELKEMMRRIYRGIPVEKN